MLWCMVRYLYLLVEWVLGIYLKDIGKKLFKSCFSLLCQGISPDELKDELPERQPRYPFLSSLKIFVSFSGQNFIYDV